MLDDLEHQLLRQQDLNYQHAVCDAHPELEHLRPYRRIIGGPKIIDDITERECDPYPLDPTTMQEAATRAAYKYGITPQQLRGHGRSRNLVAPRKEFVKTCRTTLCKSFPEIARFMDDRDHSSVFYYWKLSQQDEERVAA